MTLDEHWVKIADAPARIHRSRSTVYDWVSRGLVRTIKPGREVWVNVPDLIRVEGSMTRGRPKSKQ